ncbi:hypothetical protein Btru_071481 [Bulinus truncatus]|nr:hypothetical protein Btru_071481 [Bulinus truncatus]
MSNPVDICKKITLEGFNSMTISENVTNQADQFHELMTESDYVIFEGTLCILRGCLALFGSVGNVVTILTFISVGLNGGVTTSFVFLAMSDMSYLITVLARAVAFAFMVSETTFMHAGYAVEPYGVYIFFGHAGRIPYILSNLITTMVAVMRCLCVVHPIRFKSAFSTKLSMIASLSFALLSVSSYTPVLCFMSMTWQYNPALNVSRPSLWLSPHREAVKDVVWTARDALIPFTTELIMLSCIVIMSQRLKQVYDFRQGIKAATLCVEDTPFKSNDIDKNISLKSRLSGKELQALRQVLVITTFYLLCNTPTIAINITSLYKEQLSIDDVYRNIYLSVTGVKHLFQTANSSFSVLVYYTFNSRYRQRFVLKCNK